MRVRSGIGAGLASTAVAVGAIALAAPAGSAVPSWKAPMTVAKVRGIPDPMVATDRTGRATIVFSSAPVGSTARRPTIYSVVRTPGQAFGRPAALGSGVGPRIAVNPDGATAVAWIDGQRIQILLQPAPGQLGAPGGIRRSIDAPGGATSLRLTLDGAGRATLAWLPDAASDLPKEVQARAVAVAADGSVGTVQELGSPATCARFQLVGNAAGDTLAACFPGTTVHYRDAGAASFVTETYHQNYLHSEAYATVDGAGTMTIALPSNSSGTVGLGLVERRRGGQLAQGRGFGDADGASIPRIFAQEGRSVVVWTKAGVLRYAVRPAGGDFEPERTLRIPGNDLPPAFAEVTAPAGPLPLLLTSAVPATEGRAPLVLHGAEIGADGTGRASGRVAVPGQPDFPGNVAASESGIAVATWEQRCGDGFAVMAMALDERRGTTDPPCQDQTAPRVLIRPQRARLAGRKLRFRVGCDEACRLVVRTRVLRRGQGRPLATAKTPRPRALPAGAYRSLALRLRASDAARIRVALATGRRVTVRFAMSVRDDFENGAVRRLAVPLRR